MGRSRIGPQAGEAAVKSYLYGEHDRETTALAVRYLLQVLEETVPGNSVEVRIPPFGAIQCVGGPRHSRGTPPNVIEMDSEAWISLAVGSMAWGDALANQLISASGSRASLETIVPLNWRVVGEN
ncbi:MAG: hypothetical protein KF844_03680 [Cryobacterium sp.]|nr:hypothetical protein [Cryobacterium sp.]